MKTKRKSVVASFADDIGTVIGRSGCSRSSTKEKIKMTFCPSVSSCYSWKWLWLDLLLLLGGIVISLPSSANSSHIMTSESGEAEFEMIYNGQEANPTGENIPPGSNNNNDDFLPGAHPISPPNVTAPNSTHPKLPLHLDEETMKELDEKTERLRKIEELSTGLLSEACMGNHEYEMMKDVNLSTEFANVIMEKVDMIVSFLYKLKKYESRIRNKKEVERDEQEVYRYVLETVREAYPIKDLRLLIYTIQSQEQNIYTLSSLTPNPSLSENLTKLREKNGEISKKPWYFNPNAEFDSSKFMSHPERSNPKSTYHKNKIMDVGMNGGSFWTWLYCNCSILKNQKILSENELIIRSQYHRQGHDSSSSPHEHNSRGHLGHNNHGGHAGHFSHENNNNGDLVHNNNKKVRATNVTNEQKHHHRGKSVIYRANAWFASYTAWFPIHVKDSVIEEYGELSIDLDLSSFEINQCGFEDEGRREWDIKENPMFYFRDTHKCDRLRGTSTCHFIKGNPMRGSSYECRCARNMYAYNKTLNNTVAGAIAEAAWVTMRENKTNGNDSIMYQDIVTCKTCPDGCDDCIEGVSCLAPISWVFRLVLLCISIICSVGSVALIFVTYSFRKSPVLKSSSPLFHCITLLGCVIMYSEMVVLFPVLNQATCVAVKWTRHLGFCVTYTALYMKLCRVYLTFRVKSAHKIKLTEKHLLHWMSPVMVVMLLYLFAWTISDPPSIEPMFTTEDLKFFQCVYNWWDHALAIGEMIFLMYGVWICWRIRENPDAQFISYSIYNIAFTNLIMVTFHLLIIPQAGPDTKYLLAFMRTQLSTTVTIALVFGSKLLSVLRRDPKAMKDIPTSANGFGHETLDLAEENQQLKEELTKMATQIEKLKSYAMCKNNPHIKSVVNITTDADFNKLDAFSSL